MGKTEAGNTFNKAFPMYKETIQKPFSDFVRKVFRMLHLIFDLLYVYSPTCMIS